MFTITIPTRDRPRLLLRALASVRAQDFPDFRVIVVDDGDGSGAEAAAALCDPHILTRSSGRAGQVAARNLAIAGVDDGWIAWLDDDDEWRETDHLSRIAAVAARGPALVHASGRLVLETADAEPVGELPFVCGDDAAGLDRDNRLLASGIAYPAIFHRRFGTFDETLPIYWDWDWYLRLVRAGVPLVASGGTGIACSTRSDNTSSAANEAVRRADLARLSAKHGLLGLVLKNHRDIAEEQVAHP